MIFLMWLICVWPTTWVVQMSLESPTQSFLANPKPVVYMMVFALDHGILILRVLVEPNSLPAAISQTWHFLLLFHAIYSLPISFALDLAIDGPDQCDFQHVTHPRCDPHFELFRSLFFRVYTYLLKFLYPSPKHIEGKPIQITYQIKQVHEERLLWLWSLEMEDKNKRQWNQRVQACSSSPGHKETACIKKKISHGFVIEYFSNSMSFPWILFSFLTENKEMLCSQLPYERYPQNQTFACLWPWLRRQPKKMQQPQFWAPIAIKRDLVQMISWLSEMGLSLVQLDWLPLQDLKYRDWSENEGKIGRREA